jgi:hypothetical protein
VNFSHIPKFGILGRDTRAAAKPSSSSTTSTGHTSDIKCRHCHGVGHF